MDDSIVVHPVRIVPPEDPGEVTLPPSLLHGSSRGQATCLGSFTVIAPSPEPDPPTPTDRAERVTKWAKVAYWVMKAAVAAKEAREAWLPFTGKKRAA